MKQKHESKKKIKNMLKDRNQMKIIIIARKVFFYNNKING